MTKYYFRLNSIVLFAVTAALLALSANVSAGKVYKWIDKNGKTHFSQTPPHADTREYDVRFAAPKPEPIKQDDLTKNTNKQEQEAKKERPKTPQERLAEIEKARAEQAKIAMQKAKVRDEKIKKCKKAQSSMRNIDQGGRIYDVTKEGQREYWDDNKRSARKQEAQTLIDKYCE